MGARSIYLWACCSNKYHCFYFSFRIAGYLCSDWMLKITLTIFFSLVSKSFTLSLIPFPPPSPIVINCQLFQCNIMLQFAFNPWNTVPLRSSFALLRAHQHFVDCRWNRWIGVSIGFELASFRRYFVYFPKSKDECKEDVAV